MTTRLDSPTAKPEIQGTTPRANSEVSVASITRMEAPGSGMPKRYAISARRLEGIDSNRVRTAASSGGASISSLGNSGAGGRIRAKSHKNRTSQYMLTPQVVSKGEQLAR